ncbi:MAG: hypothetical protein V1862_07630 [Methanobacteriota archaeon]
MSEILPPEYQEIYARYFHQSPESFLKDAIIRELKRKLAQYTLTDYRLRHKYNMCFDDFRTGKIVEKMGYSFEAEQDYLDWEISCDGIFTIKEELGELGQ